MGVIGRLRGTLAEQDDTRLLVDCGGVGYEVLVSTYTMMSLPPVGDPVTLRIFTHALENKVALYGFGSPMERDLFDLLITVKKVGPASAVGILSAGLGPEDIARMIATQEITQLTKLRGVGKKTAEMLVVELREKCEMLLASWAASGDMRSAAPAVTAVTPARPAIVEQVISALVQLGWRPVEAEKAAAELTVDEDTDLESLIRQALRAMPR